MGHDGGGFSEGGESLALNELRPETHVLDSARDELGEHLQGPDERGIEIVA
jgi:hypothetical protein